MVVNDDQDRRFPSSLLYSGNLCPPIQQHAKAAHARIAPVLLLHLRSVGIDPGQILHPQLLVVLAGEKEVAAENGIAVAEVGESTGKSNQRLALFLQIPVEPADLVVLAIS